MTTPPAGRGPARQRRRRPSRPTSRVKWKRLRSDPLTPLGRALPQYAFGVTTSSRTAGPTQWRPVTISRPVRPTAAQIRPILVNPLSFSFSRNL